MPTNDFKRFAYGVGANVIPQVTYESSPLLSSGYLNGVADPQYLNKTWRQSATMASALGDFIVAAINQNVVDDGTTVTIANQLRSSVLAISSTGISNAAANYYAAVTFGGF